MGVETLFLTERLYAYLSDVGVREAPALRALREASAGLEEARRQSSPEQAQLMSWLIRLIGARRALDVGTFYGYSALTLALAVPPDGLVLSFDVDETRVETGRRFWREAGVEDRIVFEAGPALETLGRLAESDPEPFDFAYLDADKPNHDAYYELLLRLIRPGGVIALNNFFAGGFVADDPEANPEFDGEDVAYVKAVQELNLKLRDDERVSVATVPVSDGIVLAAKL